MPPQECFRCQKSVELNVRVLIPIVTPEQEIAGLPVPVMSGPGS
jgi:hypothetical protein